MDVIEEMISNKEINRKIETLAGEINEYYQGDEVLVICLLKGAMVFTADLIRNLNMPLKLDFIRASSYNDKTYSEGKVDITEEIKINFKNKNVLIVDDIIDTGYTLYEIKKILKNKGAKTVLLCTLFDKPKRKVDIESDFVGFKIPDEFIVGYGLDYKQKYRNLPYIGKVKQKKL